MAQSEVRALNQLKPVGPTLQSTNRNVKPQWAQPPPPPAIVERRGLEIDLNEKPTDHVSVTCQSDREEKAAKSAMARKRRLEIQRERRRTSTAYKRPRVQ